MWVSLGVGISGSLIAAAIYLWITEQRLIPALIIGGAGVAGFLITWLFSRKRHESAFAPSSVNQDVRQEANPQINSQISSQFNPVFSPQNTVIVGIPDHHAEANKRESEARDSILIEHMKTTHPTVPYLIDELSKGLGIAMPDVRDALERLSAKQAVVPIKLDQAIGGFAYRLDELYQPNPLPKTVRPNTVTTYTVTTGNELLATDPQVLLEYHWRDTRDFQSDSMNMPLTIWNAGKETAVNFQIADIRNGSWRATFAAIPHLAAGDKTEILASVDYDGLRTSSLAHSLISMVKPASVDDAKRESHTMQAEATYSNPRGQRFSGKYEFQWNHKTGECSAILKALSRLS
jgi:hypothetical protein